MFKLLPHLRNLMLPVFEMDQNLPRTGLIYEIGCGSGSLAAQLARLAPTRQVVGLDIDENKITQARKMYQEPNLVYKLADANRFHFSPWQGAVLSDFLHHLTFEQQGAVLDHLVGQITNRGKLVIKEIAKNDGWRMYLSRFWDLLLYPRDKIFYRSTNEWLTFLKKKRLKVRFSREVAWFPGSTFLFVCSKS